MVCRDGWVFFDGGTGGMVLLTGDEKHPMVFVFFVSFVYLLGIPTSHVGHYCYKHVILDFSCILGRKVEQRHFFEVYSTMEVVIYTPL